MQQGEPQSGEPDEHTSPRDRWWFSPALQLLAGFAVVGFQWGPISNGTANALNWLVGLAGIAVFLMGALGLYRARDER